MQGRQTHRQTDTHLDARQTDTQTDRHTPRCKGAGMVSGAGIRM